MSWLGPYCNNNRKMDKSIIKRKHGCSGNKSNMGNLHMFQNPIWKPLICSCGLLLLFKEIWGIKTIKKPTFLGFVSQQFHKIGWCNLNIGIQSDVVKHNTCIIKKIRRCLDLATCFICKLDYCYLIIRNEQTFFSNQSKGYIW